MKESPLPRSRTWLWVPILALPIELFLWFFFFIGIFLGGDTRYGITKLAWLLYLAYPVWLVLSLILQKRAYRSELIQRVKMLFLTNLAYLFLLIMIGFIVWNLTL